MNYRPWGPFEWLSEKLDLPRWAILGTIATEERCRAVPEAMGRSLAKTDLFIRIEDPEPAEPSKLMESLDSMQRRFESMLGEAQVVRQGLLADIDTIRELAEQFIHDSGGRIVMDVSAMPKYWFFPLTRFLLDSENVTDLAICYSSAAKYASKLHSNIDPFAPLPTFENDATSHSEHELIVGVGHAPMGIKDIYDERNHVRVRYLFPFPPGPPHVRKNWEFLRKLKEQIGHENRYEAKKDRWHVHMYDVPAIFDALSHFSKGGRRPVVLAPFGPKTMSLAMCLFALSVEEVSDEKVAALYTQPKQYALDYTSGIRDVEGRPDIRAYLVKTGGRRIYSLNKPTVSKIA